jgi:hypothetical protein
MGAFTRKHKRTNAPDTCLYCGDPLKVPQYAPEGSGKGYRGTGHFCTVTCGWRFALVFAESGRRLTPEGE